MSRSIQSIRTVFAIVALLLASAAHADKNPVYTSLFSNTALSGYDAVAYFTAGEPVRGDKQFTHDWQGARWLFSSAENRDRFIDDPERYAPQFGGYCAWAVSQGYTAKADPEVWAIVDGKLYVNYNAEIGEKWAADRDALIVKANQNWPNVLSD